MRLVRMSCACFRLALQARVRGYSVGYFDNLVAQGLHILSGNAVRFPSSTLASSSTSAPSSSSSSFSLPPLSSLLHVQGSWPTSRRVPRHASRVLSYLSHVTPRPDNKNLLSPHHYHKLAPLAGACNAARAVDAGCRLVGLHQRDRESE